MLTSLALSLAAAPVSVATSDLALELAELGRAFLDEGSTSGFSMAVDVGGEIVFAGGFGWSDAGARRAADERSTYAAPELVEPWVAALVLRRVEAGALALDDPLARRLPLAAELEVAPELTLGHLLAHTSGLAEASEVERARGAGGAAGEGVERADAFARALLAAPRTAAPGACRADNEGDTLLLTLVLEHAAGQPLATLVRDELIAPLELEATGPCSADAPRASLEPCTTALDLLAFQRGLAAGELLPDRALERMTEEALLADGSGTGHGRGVDLRPLDGEPCWSYGGGPDGTRVLVAYHPRFDLTIVALSGEDAPLERLERRIARKVLDRRDPTPKDLALDAEQAARYVGRYTVGCLQVDIELGDEGLVVHPPFGVPHVLAWQGDHEFVAADDPELRLRFELEDGRPALLVLDDHGTRTEARRG